MAIPQVKNGCGLHLAVRADGASLRVIVQVLLSIAPMGLQMQPDKSRLEVLIHSAQASVIKRGINIPAVLEHGPRS